jgi:hypothetical protein
VRPDVVAAAGAAAAGADLVEHDLEDVRVVPLADLTPALLAAREVVVRLGGPDAAADVGAAAALVRLGVHGLVTEHVRAVRRAVDVLAAVQAAR